MDTPLQAGLIGHAIAASRTPSMHEEEGKALGLTYQYHRLDIATPDYRDRALGDLLAEAEARGFQGVNITHPFKVEAVALADELAPTAADIGAINTMVFHEGRRIGYNTDYIGFRSALGAETELGSINKVLLMGAGGAGAAVGLALLDQGVEDLTICDPTEDRATALAEKLASLRATKIVRGLSDLSMVDLSALNGVVNATPLGMKDHPGMAISPEMLDPSVWISDIVYFPLETALLKAAQQHGHRVMLGSGMAIYQAVAAFELFTGLKADPARMRSIAFGPKT